MTPGKSPHSKCVVSKQVPIFSPRLDLMDRVWDTKYPSLMDSIFHPFKHLMDYGFHSPLKHTVYCEVGYDYKPEDISVIVEDGKLKISGKTHIKDAHGSSNHEFSREWDLPKDVDVTSMKTELSPYGILKVEFHRSHTDYSKYLYLIELDLVDDSTPDTYRVKLKLGGFTPEQMSVTSVGKDLIIEGNREKSETSKDGRSQFYESGHYKRKLSLGHDIEPDTLKARFSKEGELEITAKRDPKKIMPEEKKLKIEHAK